MIALYVELTDRIIPSLGFTRSGPGQRPEVTDAELVCLAVAQVLLRFDDERHWLCAARWVAGATVADIGCGPAASSETVTLCAIQPPRMRSPICTVQDQPPGRAHRSAAQCQLAQ